jgi:SAM-dependent methyltransferase
VTTFYDQLASLYHLIYEDWDATITVQAHQLASIIAERWGLAAGAALLDVSCGIGTQAIGLAQRGFRVTASDLSEHAIERARVEAQQRTVPIDFSVCDMREVSQHHQRQFDVVISCDNSITHLLTDADILLALRQMYARVRPGGGCVLTVRDYAHEARGVGIVKPYGVRNVQGKRHLLLQVWDFIGDIYDLALYVVIDDPHAAQPLARVMRSRYYAIGTDRLCALMEQAGFTSVTRLDGRFFQPVLIGDKIAEPGS